MDWTFSGGGLVMTVPELAAALGDDAEGIAHSGLGGRSGPYDASLYSSGDPPMFGVYGQGPEPFGVLLTECENEGAAHSVVSEVLARVILSCGRRDLVPTDLYWASDDGDELAIVHLYDEEIDGTLWQSATCLSGLHVSFSHLDSLDAEETVAENVLMRGLIDETNDDDYPDPAEIGRLLQIEAWAADLIARKTQRRVAEHNSTR